MTLHDVMAFDPDVCPLIDKSRGRLARFSTEAQNLNTQLLASKATFKTCDDLIKKGRKANYIAKTVTDKYGKTWNIADLEKQRSALSQEIKQDLKELESKLSLAKVYLDRVKDIQENQRTENAYKTNKVEVYAALLRLNIEEQLLTQSEAAYLKANKQDALKAQQTFSEIKTTLESNIARSAEDTLLLEQKILLAEGNRDEALRAAEKVMHKASLREAFLTDLMSVDIEFFALDKIDETRLKEIKQDLLTNQNKLAEGMQKIVRLNAKLVNETNEQVEVEHITAAIERVKQENRGLLEAIVRLLDKANVVRRLANDSEEIAQF